ncbi:hypothetical protein LTR17_019460 [Elasticomyces elasticus]|nr:hypothetical protein LTR17_019460 [Elasticomyces elasticus]
MSSYFVVGSLAKNDAEIVRMAGLLRGTESAAQAVSYGLCSIKVMGEVGTIYINFGLWALSIVPAWFVVREIGVTIGRVRDVKDADTSSNEVGEEKVSG